MLKAHPQDLAFVKTKHLRGGTIWEKTDVIYPKLTIQYEYASSRMLLLAAVASPIIALRAACSWFVTFMQISGW